MAGRAGYRLFPWAIAQLTQRKRQIEEIKETTDVK